MLGPGIPALAYLGGIQLDGLAHVLRERRIALHELGVEPVVQPQHVGEHQHLAVAGWPRADADGGDRGDLVIWDASGAGMSSSTMAKAPACSSALASGLSRSAAFSSRPCTR